MRSDILCEVREMPADEVIMTCVAMGCPDANFAANAVRSDREHNDEFVSRVGFAEQTRTRRIFSGRNFLVRCRKRPLAISEVREEQCGD